MNSRHLLDRFESVRARGEPLVLVTVYETLGSTYSKPGTRMLITGAGESQGLVSGGCLEGDLAERAGRVLAARQAATVTYDLRDDADELFGLGIGCNGLISVLLQPLLPEQAYEPLTTIAAALLGERSAGLALLIAPGPEAAATTPAGGTLVVVAGAERNFGMPAALLPFVREQLAASRQHASAHCATDAAGNLLLFAPLLPVPRVLILGAGLDAVPLVNVIAELGWRVAVADHRPAYLARGGLGRAESLHTVQPTRLARELDLDAFDAIVVMSHHLLTDLEYLRQLRATATPYLGLLGPPARRRRLLDDLGAAAAGLDARLKGPVGIDIGADSAESIALSIAAEMQSVLATGALSDFRRRA
jgi:xanthine/CO dehydrogenase XdhC/CoxF family maturation factor